MINTMNSLFIEKAAQEGLDKTAEQLSTYLRSKLRQDGVVRRVIAPVPITDTDLERTVDDNIPRVIMDKEPDTVAMVMNFRDEGDVKFFTSDKYEAKFFKVETEHLKRTEIELSTIRMPIEEILKQTSIFEIQKTEDKYFWELLNKGVIAADGGTGSHDIPAPIPPATAMLDLTTISEMAKAQVKTHARAHTFIVSESRWLDILQYDSVAAGDSKMSEILVDGYKYHTLGGYNFVTSIENDVWLDNQAWCLPAPQFLGSFFLYGDPKHCVDKRGDQFEFWAYEYPAMAIGNIDHIIRYTFS